jgi:hypothetical protein
MSAYLPEIFIAVLLLNLAAAFWFMADSALRRDRRSKMPHTSAPGQHPLRRRTDQRPLHGELA